MTFRLHSRLVLWNLLIIAIVSGILATGETRGRLGIAMLIAAVLILVFGYVVKDRIVIPLAELSSSAKKLSAGDLAQRLPIRGDDEIAALGASLNTMVLALSSEIRELSDRKQRLELIVGAMREGVLVLDGSGRVSLANRSMRELLGADRDPTGMTLLDVFRRPELEDAVRSVLDGGAAVVVEVTTLSGRTLQANVAPVANLSGIVDFVVAVFHDLTEIRRTERMRRDFVANVSHEFKTPLTSIRGYAETLLAGACEDPKLRAGFLMVIERNALHLESLVSDLLMLARLESELPASTAPVNIRGLIDEQISARRDALDERRIRVAVNCPPIEIEADRTRMATALSNLLDNAIQYNRPGGEVRISVVLEKGSLRIDIADTGHGIPARDLHRVFERFYRVDKARGRESGGTGLGLSIVKHAIESQGGTIQVSSRVGAGSTFTIRLPEKKGATMRAEG